MGGKLRELGSSVFALLLVFHSENIEYIAKIFPGVGYRLGLYFCDGGDL